MEQDNDKKNIIDIDTIDSFIKLVKLFKSKSLATRDIAVMRVRRGVPCASHTTRIESGDPRWVTPVAGMRDGLRQLHYTFIVVKVR